jgi:hypothetical protein
MTLAGFPHSGITGSKPACGSPMLIAAYRALHRLSVPRHPPCALVRLTGYLYPLPASRLTRSGARPHPTASVPELSIPARRLPPGGRLRTAAPVSPRAPCRTVRIQGESERAIDL